jgi:uncharacterized membrane protein YphA (DoxX/SURF4 family)
MKNQTRTGISLLVLLLTALALSFAHGGFDHVRGTVVGVENNVLTVKTDAGNVAVKLDGRTQFTKDGKKVQIAELVPGVRVIVEVPQGKEKVAQSVKIGVAAAGKGGKK